MERTLAHTLTLLGCNDKQVRFYRASLELGTATLMEIAKRARLQRSTAYMIADEMVALELISEDHRNYKKQYVVAEPDTLLRKLEAKHRQIGRNVISFKEILPELRAAHQTTSTRPRVRTYEGKQGLLAVWKDILAEKQEILLWTNQQTESLVFQNETHFQFIEERLRKNIPIRVLAVDNTDGRKLLGTDAQSLRETRILPTDMQFTSETYIYGNKVAVLDIGKDIFGVITENEQNAASQRAVFEHSWARAKG
jgi:sugar-specific transcriptional regulator TrmB